MQWTPNGQNIQNGCVNFRIELAALRFTRQLIFLGNSRADPRIGQRFVAQPRHRVHQGRVAWGTAGGRDGNGDERGQWRHGGGDRLHQYVFRGRRLLDGPVRT
jgi:hypothetical protein